MRDAAAMRAAAEAQEQQARDFAEWGARRRAANEKLRGEKIAQSWDRAFEASSAASGTAASAETIAARPRRRRASIAASWDEAAAPFAAASAPRPGAR
jgi:hypothetical protein